MSEDKVSNETTAIADEGAQTAAEMEHATVSREARVPKIQHRVTCNHDEQHGCGKDTGTVVELPFDLSEERVRHALRGYLCEDCGPKHAAARHKAEAEQERLITAMLGPQTSEPVMVRMARRFEDLQQQLNKLQGKTT